MSNCKPIQLYWTNTPTTFQQEREVIVSAQLTWKHTWYQRQEKRKISEQKNCLFFFLSNVNFGFTVFSPLWLKCVKNMWINGKKTVASTREKEIKERLTRNCLKRTKKLFPPTLTPADTAASYSNFVALFIQLVFSLHRLPSLLLSLTVSCLLSWFKCLVLSI